MRKFRVKTTFAGYVRGRKEYLVEAQSLEEARDWFWDSGELLSKVIIRDDTEEEIDSVQEVIDE